MVSTSTFRGETSMHEPEALVRVGEGVRDLGADVGDLRCVERALREQLADRRALDVLHREEVRAVHDAELVHGHDVRMTELHERVRLAHEELDEARIDRELREDLLHDERLLEAAEASEAGAVHARHPPACQEAVEQVAPEGLRLPRRLHAFHHPCERVAE